MPNPAPQPQKPQVQQFQALCEAIRTYNSKAGIGGMIGALFLPSEGEVSALVDPEAAQSRLLTQAESIVRDHATLLARLGLELTQGRGVTLYSYTGTACTDELGFSVIDPSRLLGFLRALNPGEVHAQLIALLVQAADNKLCGDYATALQKGGMAIPLDTYQSIADQGCQLGGIAQARALKVHVERAKLGDLLEYQAAVQARILPPEDQKIPYIWGTDSPITDLNRFLQQGLRTLEMIKQNPCAETLFESCLAYFERITNFFQQTFDERENETRDWIRERYEAVAERALEYLREARTGILQLRIGR